MSKEDFQHLQELLNSEYKNRGSKTFSDIPEELRSINNTRIETRTTTRNVGSNGLAKHKFEVPFNGDKNLISRIAERNDLRDFVKFIYLPCNIEHGIVTSPGERKNIMTVEDTEKVIKFIQDKGFNPGILIQRGDNLEGMSFYVERGCRYFTIGDDNLARKARDKWGNDVYLTASVTNLRSFNDYFHVEPGLYDIMILYFWFNRHIEHLKALPKWNKYGIFVNNICLWNCPWSLSHWFPNRYKPKKSGFNCADLRLNKDNKSGGIKMESVCYIKPSDLHYFEDYVDTYKLIDRMSPTQHILSDLELFVNQRDIKSTQFKDPSLGEKNYQIEPFAPTDTVDKIRVAEERK